VATFVNDTFTGADGTLRTHTGETGATWTHAPGDTTGGPGDPTNDLFWPKIQSNRIHAAGGANSILYASGTPGAADYTVTMPCVFASATWPSIVGPAGRMTTSGNNGYFAILFGGGINLYKYVTGSLTLIGSKVNITAAADTYTVTLDMQGTTIAVRVRRASDSQWLASSNTWQAGQVNAISQTDSALSAAGKAGFWAAGTLSNVGYMESITAADGLADPVTGTGAVTEAADTSTASGTVAVVSVAITSTDLVWSPFNWYSNGGGAMQASSIKASSTYAQSNNVGAYMKFAVSSVATGPIVLNLDTSMLTAITSGSRPMIGWTIDGGAIQTSQLTTISATHTVTLGTDLGSGTHQIVVYVYSINFGDTGDRWTGPALTVRITGITLPFGGATVAVTHKTNRTLVYGDSIAEGAEINGTGTGVANGGGNIVWGNLIHELLDSEVGIVAYSGQAYSGTATSLDAVWDLYHTGASRLTAGAFTTTPRYILCNHGKVDNPTSAQIGAALAEIAAAAPSADMVVIPTFDRENADDILAATLPANARFLDLGVLEEYGEGGGDWTVDSGSHMNEVGHAAVALLIADGVTTVTGTAAVTEAADTSTASGGIAAPVTGTAAVTEAADTSTASGTSGFPVAGNSSPVVTFKGATVVRTFNV
jgi:hypothetical protein